MNILFLVFGKRLSDHLQAHLAIHTLLPQLTKGDRICVMTTAPEFYSGLSSVEQVKTDPITEQTLDEWEGQHHFFWRVKIKAMERMVTLYPDDELLYLDSDTFLKGNLEDIKGILRQGKGLMHLDEGHPSNMKTKSLRMWNTVNGRTYAGVTIGKQHNMWNAGVVAMPKGKVAQTVALALAICDGMLNDGAERVVIEQYSLSIALHERLGLVSAQPYIGHYWGNKDEWNAFASDFFLAAYMKGLTPQEATAALMRKDLTAMRIHVHKSNTQRRLTNIIKKLFPDK